MKKNSSMKMISGSDDVLSAGISRFAFLRIFAISITVVFRLSLGDFLRIDLLDLFLLILLEFVVAFVEILLRAFFTQFIICRYEFVLNVQISLILRIHVVLNRDYVILGIVNHTKRSSEILLKQLGQRLIVLFVLNELGGIGAGRRRASPWFTSIEVVTRKKISNRNEMSAIELALICGTFFAMINVIYFSLFVWIYPQIIVTMVAVMRM